MDGIIDVGANRPARHAGNPWLGWRREGAARPLGANRRNRAGRARDISAAPALGALAATTEIHDLERRAPSPSPSLPRHAARSHHHWIRRFVVGLCAHRAARLWRRARPVVAGHGRGGRRGEADTRRPPGRAGYSKEEILAIARGEVFGKNNARLPLPPMLMMDRITEVSEDGGLHGKGHVVAELDINPDLWFFPCHFDGNPIMPGCLGLDALWQLTGFNLAWRGWPGAGYALGVGNVKFTGMVRPDRKVLRYEVDFTKTVKSRRLTMASPTARCTPTASSSTRRPT